MDVILHKSTMTVGVGGGGKDGKVSIIGVLENKLGITLDKEGMEMLSMVVSMVGMMCLDVASPCGS